MAGYVAVFLKISDAPDKHLFRKIHSVLSRNGLSRWETITFRYHTDYNWLQIQDLPWIEHLLDGTDTNYQPKFLAALSAEFQADVIGLYYQSVVDAIAYWHFQKGAETRCLIHGFQREGGWAEVRGANEIWEDKVFFDRHTYVEILAEEGEIAAEAEEMLATKQIKLNSSLPLFTSFDVAQIGEYFKLPGFSGSLKWSLEENYSRLF